MLSKKGFDLVRPIHRSSRFDKHKLKAKVPINLLVDAFETERIFETDAPCRGGLNKSKAADKERFRLIKLLRYHALQFP